MGLIRALAGAVGGGLADQWLEVIEADEMDDSTVFCRGVAVRKNDRRSSNRKATEDTISNGSVIHVYDNQCMLLAEGGKIVDFTAEPGYYTVNNSSLPSMMSGSFGESVKEAFSRFKYGGVPSSAQKAFFINLQEIKGIKFGTRTPVNYFDNFYNSELFLRAHGTYSIKITNPLLFYTEAVPKNQSRVSINDINAQYLDEFLEALQASINRMSADGVRISFVTSKVRELSAYMAETLDEGWKKLRGMEVQSVGLASISYDEESQKLINMRNQGAMLGDPAIREAYVQGSIARGLEAAGSNAAGSMAGFMGVGMGMQGTGGFMAAASQENARQMRSQAEQNAVTPQEQNQGQGAGFQNTASHGNGTDKTAGTGPGAAGTVSGTNSWTCGCGTANTGKFCSECGKPRPVSWKCSCGSINTGKFCPDCGAGNPERS